MRSIKRVALITTASLVFVSVLPGQPACAQAQRPASIEAWSPKPVEPGTWVAPNKPHWKLAEILAKHAKERSWTETIVSDRDFSAQYIAMAPGESTKPRFYADNRVVWIVQAGQIRFMIEGQEPFIASKGFLAQVPYRTTYRLETVGDVPSLRFEVIASGGVSPVFPITETPTPVPGRKYIKVIFTGRGMYDDVNKPYLDFNKDVVLANGRGGPFVKDDKTFLNLIRGHGQPPPPASNLGHFHLDFSEFWFILEGQVDFQIEGQPFFTADQGDIVYAPQGRWHRASFGGTGMSTRVAINPRPEGMHNFQAPDD